MLTRLKVNGFKNLVNVDLRFGPFTCVAGANGVGKSNLFDAITFLSALSHMSFVEAARTVRDESGQHGNAQNLFHRSRMGSHSEMSFEAELLISPSGIDDLGQTAEAVTTFVTYSIVLGARDDDPSLLELRHESLDRIAVKEAAAHLLFPMSKSWLKSVVQGRRTSPFISTEDSANEGGGRIVKLHQDGVQGAALRRPLKTLPRTVLSSVNAAESPTALLVKRELQSWRQLQLEPSAMRRSDDFRAPHRIGVDGSHLPATLFHLARQARSTSQSESTLTDAQVYGRVASRLSELIDGVRDIKVERDEKRESFTIVLRDHERREFPARDLSDGTLRFLALSILELDTNSPGVVCFEEPENGIHPERIPSMLQLLGDMATDPSLPVGADNPLRQVIVNTHSPVLVQQVAADSLVVAELIETLSDGQLMQSVNYGCLPSTWRSKSEPPARQVPLGKLISYLNPPPAEPVDSSAGGTSTVGRSVMELLGPSRQLTWPWGLAK